MNRVWLHVFAPVVVVLVACTPAAAPATTNGGSTPPATGATSTTGGSSPAATAAPAGEQRADNQELRVAQTGIPASLSPETSSTNIAFFSAIYDSLVMFDKTYKIVPQVAEKWEYKDGKWLFTIRKDMKFTDGSPLTVDDVVFSLNLIPDNKLPQTSYLGNLASAKAIDDKTVEVTPKTPDATLINGMPWAFVLPKAFYDKVGKSQFGIQAIGTGPYEVESFSPSVNAVFKKKAATHPFRKVIATKLTFTSVPEESAIVAGLRTGEIDLTAHATFSVDNIEKMKGEGIGIQSVMASNIAALMPQVQNKERDTPLQNPKVRQAIQYAVNRDAMVKGLFKGLAIPAYQLSMPGSEMWIDGIKPIPYDPAKAKQLLAEAGYPNGFKLPLGIDFTSWILTEQVPLAMQADLKAVGIEAEVKNWEIGAYLDRFYGRNGATRADFMFWSSGDADGVSGQYRGRLACDLPTPNIWWCNETFVKLFDESRTEADPAKRSKLVQQAHQALLDDNAFVTLLVQPLYVLNGKNIRGVEYTTSIVFRFDTAYRVK